MVKSKNRNIKLETSGLESIIESFLKTMFVRKDRKISMKIVRDRWMSLMKITHAL